MTTKHPKNKMLNMTLLAWCIQVTGVIEPPPPCPKYNQIAPGKFFGAISKRTQNTLNL